MIINRKYICFIVFRLLIVIYNNSNSFHLFLFVNIAWDAVMREMPVTAGGRIQFYSGQ